MGVGAVFSAALVGTGCAHTVVETAVPDATLRWGNEDIGEIPQGGVSIDVFPGFGPVPYELTDGAGRRETGVVERDRLFWPMLVPSVAATLGCVPSGAAFGLACSQPSLWLLPCLGFLGTAGCQVGANALLGACFAPSWATGPCCVGGALCGTLPLAVLPFAGLPPARLRVGDSLVDEGRGMDPKSPAPTPPGPAPADPPSGPTDAPSEPPVAAPDEDPALEVRF